MENYNSNIDDLIIAYLRSEITDCELSVLKNWIDEAPENKEYFDQLLEVWLSVGVVGGCNNFDKEKMFAYFKARVKRYENEHEEEPKSKPLLFSKYILRYAAILTILFTTTTALYFGYKYTAQNDANLLVNEIEAPRGSISKIVLGDGTTVCLNAGSKLFYSNSFSRKDRNVRLEGEAYFEVTKNKDLPFVVKTNGVDVKVLGTKFNVINYKDEPFVHVTLMEGSVQMLNVLDNQTFILKPNQSATVEKGSGLVTLNKVNAEEDKLWTDNILFFNGKSVEYIFRQLERSFGVTIVVDNKECKNRVFYGDFRNNESLPQILEIMSSDLFTYTRKGNVITIK